MSTEPELKQAHERGYSKGYRAGRKRTAAEDETWQRMHAEIHAKDVARRDRFFCAALNGLIVKGGWTMDGKLVKDMNDYIELARKFADAAMLKLPA